MKGIMMTEKFKEYCVFTTHSDPFVTMQLPQSMLKALALRAEENGHYIGLEIILRLARSLEVNHAQQKEDDLLALQAFKVISRD